MNETIVFAPGLNCTGALFTQQMEVLRPDFNILVLDHGSDATVEGIASRFLEGPAPERFALCGLSMGGYVALEVMRRAPARVSRLALLDTRASGDTPGEAEMRERTIALAEAGRLDEIFEQTWPRLVHPDRREDEALKGPVRRMARETGAAAFVRQQRAVTTRPDSRLDLPAIGVPTLILVGDEDAITPPAESRAMHGAIAGSRLVVVERCGHLSSLERPEAVTRALLEWARA